MLRKVRVALFILLFVWLVAWSGRTVQLGTACPLLPHSVHITGTNSKDKLKEHNITHILAIHDTAEPQHEVSPSCYY